MSAISKNSLTAIITFLNEGIEVENTLKSIRSTAGNSVDILTINDCSTDGFDYEAAASKYNARYHKNEERLGIAASRDLGISMIKTPYFLLLDGHMRFYDNTWVEKLLCELEKDDRVLLCCQVKPLSTTNAGNLAEKIENYNEWRSSTWGAYINFHNSIDGLRADWIVKKESPNYIELENIPCVLGASYATNKTYWKYLRGLEGLKYYGGDEEYISMKVWLEGGRCTLMNNIVVGHLFRKSFPYHTDDVFRTYNRLWISELLLPSATRSRVNYYLKKVSISIYIDAHTMLMDNIVLFKELRNYYKQIFTQDFSLIKNMNKLYISYVSKSDTLFLDALASLLIQKEDIQKLGLFYGKMGIYIFLFHYAQYKKNELLLESIQTRFYTYLRQLDIATLSNTFDDGLWGIGWGLMHLQKQGFIVNIDTLLSNIDEIIMQNTENQLQRLSDYTLKTGLGGLLFYIFNRIIKYKDKELDFQNNTDYFSLLYQLTKKAYLSENVYESIDVFLNFKSYYESKECLRDDFLNLSDIFLFPDFKGDNIKEWPLGLKNGCAGVGMCELEKNYGIK